MAGRTAGGGGRKLEPCMKIKVLFFGLLHDLTGFGEEEIAIREGETLGELWRSYEGRFPRFREAAESLFSAVNQEVTDDSKVLQDGDEVAFMPPVSGGAPVDAYEITRDPIRADDLAQRLKAPEDGAVVVFEGIVRARSHHRATLYLEYEAYEPLAIRKMEDIGREAKGKFGIDRIGMVHRVGRLEIGETSVAIVVTSPHRKAAFEACHYAIDRLKQTVPIWKKEFFADGAVWAEGEGQRRVLVEAKK